MSDNRYNEKDDTDSDLVKIDYEVVAIVAVRLNYGFIAFVQTLPAKPKLVNPRTGGNILRITKYPNMFRKILNPVTVIAMADPVTPTIEN